MDPALLSALEPAWLLRFRTSLRAPLALLSALVLVGCAGPGGVAPAVRQVGTAAADAAMHPLTWGSLAAGLAFGATGLDREVSDWAADRQPLFGSAERAADASDLLRTGLVAGMAASSLLAPLPPQDAGPSAFGRRLAANLLAYGTTRASTDGLKAAFGRERPDGADDESLPSGHASIAFTAAASIEQNLAPAALAPAPLWALRFGLYGMAGATAWARLEARKHFPSDVLAGAALGNFFSHLMFGALMGPAKAPPIAAEIASDRLLFRWSIALP